jgi:hypothetical protein
MKLLGINSVSFDVTDELLFCIHQILEKKWEYNKRLHQLGVRREVLYNILIEFWVPIKLVILSKMCLNETYGKERIRKLLSDSFAIQNGLKQEDAHYHRFSTLL